MHTRHSALIFYLTSLKSIIMLLLYKGSAVRLPERGKTRLGVTYYLVANNRVITNKELMDSIGLLYIGLDIRLGY